MSVILLLRICNPDAMASYHILNGDALREAFSLTSLSGTPFVCREAFVEGPVETQIPEPFFRERAAYMDRAYPESGMDYQTQVFTEFDLMTRIPEGSEISLWFEDDLFCQVNMWFVLFLLRGKQVTLFRVFPKMKGEATQWMGFGSNDPGDLQQAFYDRQKLSGEDRQLGEQLWKAYCRGKNTELANLGQVPSPAFRLLPEVVQAHLDRNRHPGRPEAFIRRKLAEGMTTFGEVFQAFCQEEGVYGFGDLQVKKLFDSLQ